MDIERIKDKLSELSVYIVELTEDIPDEESAYLGERLRKRACERTFQLACENVLDICNLIIAGKGFGLPKDNRDALRKIADNRIIPKKLEARLEDMVSFMNLLVHRYGKVDDSKVYYYLKEEIGDLYEFTEAINKLIE
ncbi:MAG: hypothetical protein CHKLHMKO_00363 [Candidatus Argoarchaeum ethanivorans]|uniref:DUF86 domain-containing protein n=1 Tax=Candidatus Argoarchaeum ethanivorans TaxID=2608793 RepID=A0A811TB75_9EURY|nr:MAG: hypothetical protein CHKLHMKO_00363 [Candidatus Argoarchaeum ethanivorans]